MAKTTGQALWDFCEDLLKKGAGYVWGGRGKVYDETEAQTLYKTFGNGTYDEKYYMVTSMQRWKGKVVVDCSGMIQAFRIAKLDGVDRNADSLYEKDCPEDRRGTIDTLPKNLRGVLLFKKSGSRMGHVGVYGGDNTTIESSNSKSGVIKKNPMVKSCWTHWGIPSWLEPTDLSKKPLKEEVIKPSTPLKVCKISGCFKLNVRKGSGITHKTIGTLSKGDIVEVYAIKGNWAKIDKDTDKWCSTKYLITLPKYEVVNCSHLNVRKGPSTKFDFVKVIDSGDIVWEYGVAFNGWIQIGKDMYVSNKYVSRID